MRFSLVVKKKKKRILPGNHWLTVSSLSCNVKCFVIYNKHTQTRKEVAFLKALNTIITIHKQRSETTESLYNYCWENIGTVAVLTVIIHKAIRSRIIMKLWLAQMAALLWNLLYSFSPSSFFFWTCIFSLGFIEFEWSCLLYLLDNCFFFWQHTFQGFKFYLQLSGTVSKKVFLWL